MIMIKQVGHENRRMAATSTALPQKLHILHDLHAKLNKNC